MLSTRRSCFWFGLLVALAVWLPPMAARAVLMNYTGTFSVSLEGFSASSQPFHGTADVDLSTGAFQMLGPVSPSLTHPSGTMSLVRIYTPSTSTTSHWPGSWNSVVPRRPIAAPHPLLSVVGFSQASLYFAGATMRPVYSSTHLNNFSFYLGGGYGGGFGGNGWFGLGPVSLGSRRAVGAVFFGTGASSAQIWSDPSGGVMGAAWGWQSVHSQQGLVGSGASSIAANDKNWTANNASFTIDGRLYTAPGSDNRNTTNRTGQILLVTPMRIYAGMPNGGIGGYFNLDLNFTPVPEPSTAVLLGAGLVSLALAGRSRRARN